ncbi:hypothetical protein [Nitrosomonas communis]|uniref:hypothetical protein n=1 Tax=Nitrosomonas communis TaxID=44574 RepID=UPI0015A690C4|nr:hypothetical protein [Nitrosomonas communis]
MANNKQDGLLAAIHEHSQSHGLVTQRAINAVIDAILIESTARLQMTTLLEVG